MRKILYVLVLAYASILYSAERAVTYNVSPGRFGDQLLCYLHAKWISYKYGLPLLYKPLRCSEDFALHDLEELWTEEKQRQFRAVISYNGEGDFSDDSTLYIIPFFSANEDDRRHCPDWLYFPIDWKDENFCRIIRACFAPRKKYPPVVFPDPTRLNVALHVRRGGGVDNEYAHHYWPLRFPPDTYYIEALRKLCALFPGRKFYVHIFTDDLEPLDILRSYRQELRDLPIRWGCRKEENGPDIHVMEDFFAMMQFDCLIRSVSNYTLIQARTADYQVVISPKHASWIRGPEAERQRYYENYIDEMEIEDRRK